ncbi:TetR family transcriptional regulator [Oceanibacterium hippocampi]|uniref:HTH-type transcriptional repressor NicS n=1 Tax=Oceanibacterium hippocampi TaxID=745714 RepID=A0A1Y5TN45_9PROT|nr:TetR family transcriptional regulator [Oceanibacterium hippocampi]SLN64119.1 HTH-type transcriptional repressor NicS [Oceanibacterium hippocampi]
MANKLAGSGQPPGRSDGSAENSRENLLTAARAAFAAGGLQGARVHDIARRANINKQLVYHYFGSKEGLYTAVLEDIYREIREREQALELSSLPAETALRRLIEFSFDYLAENPEFVALVADENAHGARHLNDSVQVGDLNRPIIEILSETLRRGMDEGVFRQGLDPLHVYLSMAGMAFFYFANNHTLSRVFCRPLGSPEAIAERRAQIVEFVLHAVGAR